MVLTRLGNTQVIATMTIFDEMPKRTTRSISGAIATLGTVCNATNRVDNAVHHGNLNHRDAE